MSAFSQIINFHPIDQNFQSLICTGNKTFKPLFFTSISTGVESNCVKIIVGKSRCERPGRGSLGNSDAPDRGRAWFKNLRFWRTSFVDGPQTPKSFDQAHRTQMDIKTHHEREINTLKGLLFLYTK